MEVIFSTIIMIYLVLNCLIMYRNSDAVVECFEVGIPGLPGIIGKPLIYLLLVISALFIIGFKGNDEYVSRKSRNEDKSKKED